MGRVISTGTLNVQEVSNIYVIGDYAHFKQADGKPLPGVAPVASQQGCYVAELILGKIKGDFKYFDKGSMATIGRFKAVMEFKVIKLSGLPAWLSWCFIHILFLIDFRNRIIVFVHWALAFLFFKSGVRIFMTSDKIEEVD
jgi:NADH dehydrogenase